MKIQRFHMFKREGFRKIRADLKNISGINLRILTKRKKQKGKSLGKNCIEIYFKNERILALESKNNLLIREIEDWKRRHESFQKSAEQGIERK